MSSNDTEIILYRSEDGTTKIDVRMEDEAVWLPQAQMVELFQSSKANISEHIKNIFAEGELIEDSVVRNFRTTAGMSFNGWRDAKLGEIVAIEEVVGAAKQSLF